MMFKTRIYCASFKQNKQNICHIKWSKQVTIVRLHSMILSDISKVPKSRYKPSSDWSVYLRENTGRRVIYGSTRISDTGRPVFCGTTRKYTGRPVFLRVDPYNTGRPVFLKYGSTRIFTGRPVYLRVGPYSKYGSTRKIRVDPYISGRPVNIRVDP